MLTTQEIRRALSLHRLEVVAAGTGLSYNTVRRYWLGLVKDPPLESVRLLSEWLTANPGRDTAA